MFSHSPFRNRICFIVIPFNRILDLLGNKCVEKRSRAVKRGVITAAFRFWLLTKRAAWKQIKIVSNKNIRPINQSLHPLSHSQCHCEFSCVLFVCAAFIPGWWWILAMRNQPPTHYHALSLSSLLISSIVISLYAGRFFVWFFFRLPLTGIFLAVRRRKSHLFLPVYELLFFLIPLSYVFMKPRWISCFNKHWGFEWLLVQNKIKRF